MNPPISRSSKFRRSLSGGPGTGNAVESSHSEESSLGDLAAVLWDGRYLILGSALLFMIMGAFHAWRSTPIFEATAMLQIEAQRPGSSAEAAFARMESLFSEPTEAKAEIEILSSNLVLGRTVEALGLDLETQPVLMPVIGRALVRGKATAPHLEVKVFEIPEALRGQGFLLTTQENGAFQWNAPDGSTLATGRPGELLERTFAGHDLKLQVQRMYGKPGQRFHLGRKPIQKAVADLRASLFLIEKGKAANMPATLLGLNLEHPNPNKSALILNEILNQYLRQNSERRAAEASKTRAILQEQLPALKARLQEAETRLNQFRSRSGSVDLTREADIALQQSSALNSQISALRLRKQELLRTYQENADVVTTLDLQIRKLEGEAGQVDAKVRTLPRTQQEVLRLSRDVQVNTELYTALLNSIQNLQLTLAGEVGRARVVDPAFPPLDPIKPKKGMVISAFTLMGLFLGLGLTTLQRLLHRGVEDHRLIESKLGLPVFVTIPHSRSQDGHASAIQRRTGGSHLLAVRNPDDLATESLRSLCIMLQFSMKDAPNGVIMVAGPSPSIGKSFVASNLSAVLAQGGARVLVVDGDLRRGSLHHYFGLKNRMGGLSEVLSGRAEWETVVHETEVPGLDLLTTGILPPDPSELLISPGFSEFIAAVSESYDFVMIDAPPLLSVTDATIIGTKVGTVLLLAKSGQNSLDELHACQKRFEKVGVEIKGCVFNDVRARGLGSNNQYYRYAYHYSYKNS